MYKTVNHEEINQDKWRHFFGIHGQMQDGSYCFDVPNWGGFRTKRLMYKFMFYIGNPLLNRIIGYKRLD